MIFPVFFTGFILSGSILGLSLVKKRFYGDFVLQRIGIASASPEA